MMGRKILAASLVAVILTAIGSVYFRSGPLADAVEPEPPVSGEALWRSLPPELLADVIEGKLEQIAKLWDDIARIHEIQQSRTSVARPPPDE